MKKNIIFILGIILTIALVSAIYYPEPFTNNLDINDYNISNANYISADYFNGTFTGEVTGSMNWTKLQNYPTACPGSSAITGLGDSTTCSDLWVDTAGDNMTGNLSVTGNVTANNFFGNLIGTWNSSSSYFTKIEVNAFDWTNNTLNDLRYYGINNPYSFYNSTIFDYNNYYLKSNPYSFYNSTNPQTETDPLWSSNQSSYVPYESATSNVNLGNFNFSVGTSDFFVNNENGNVGIGIASPNNLLTINGSGMLQLQTNITAMTCNEINAGAVYYNNDTNKHYGCNVTDWQPLY